MKRALILFFLTCGAIAGNVEPWAPFPLDSTNNIYDKRILSNLVYALNERANLIEGVDPIDASAMTGFITRAYLKTVDDKIEELVPYFIDRSFTNLVDGDLVYDGWFRKYNAGLDIYNFVLSAGITQGLPRLNMPQAFRQTAVGTNIWPSYSWQDQITNYPPDQATEDRITTFLCRPEYTLVPDKPVSGIIGEWKYTQAVIGGTTNEFWMDARLNTIDGDPLCFTNFTGGGLPIRSLPYQGRLYASNVFPSVQWFSVNESMDASAAGYVAGIAYDDATGLDYQYVATNTGPNFFDVLWPTKGSIGGTMTNMMIWITNSVSAWPSPALAEGLPMTPAPEVGDYIRIWYDASSIRTFSGVEPYTGIDRDYANILWRDCLNERFRVIDAMRWTTSTNFGWIAETSCISVANATVGGVTVDDFVDDNGNLSYTGVPEIVAFVGVAPWGSATGYAQASIGGATPASEPFDWRAPYDTGNYTDFDYPSDGTTPKPTFFLITNSVANPTNYLGCTSTPDLRPQFHGQAKYYTFQSRVARYYALDPDYWSALDYEPYGYGISGSTTSHWPLVGRWFVGTPVPVYVPESDSSEYYSGTVYNVSATNATSKPFVDFGINPLNHSNLPACVVDFYLFASNGVWGTSPPEWIAAKRQTFSSSAGFGAVTGDVESAYAPSFTPGAEMTNRLFRQLDSVSSVGIDISDYTNELSVAFYISASNTSTSIWVCLTNAINDSGPLGECTYGNIETNWIEITTNYWRLPDVVNTFYFECADIWYQYYPSPADPEATFTLTYTPVYYDKDPPGVCYASISNTATWTLDQVALSSNHWQYYSNVITHDPPSCQDFMELRADTVQRLEWWFWQPATNCWIDIWEPVIRWDVPGGLQYAAP